MRQRMRWPAREASPEWRESIREGMAEAIEDCAKGIDP